jgi:hypothetical protein
LAAHRASLFLERNSFKSAPAQLIPTGLDPDSCGIGVASVPARKASGSFLKKNQKNFHSKALR